MKISPKGKDPVPVQGEYGTPPLKIPAAPGDQMIQNYLEQETTKIHAKFLTNVESIEDWTKLREQYS